MHVGQRIVRSYYVYFIQSLKYWIYLVNHFNITCFLHRSYVKISFFRISIYSFIEIFTNCFECGTPENKSFKASIWDAWCSFKGSHEFNVRQNFLAVRNPIKLSSIFAANFYWKWFTDRLEDSIKIYAWNFPRRLCRWQIARHAIKLPVCHWSSTWSFFTDDLQDYSSHIGDRHASMYMYSCIRCTCFFYCACILAFPLKKYVWLFMTNLIEFHPRRRRFGWRFIKGGWQKLSQEITHVLRRVFSFLRSFIASGFRHAVCPRSSLFFVKSRAQFIRWLFLSKWRNDISSGGGDMVAN